MKMSHKSVVTELIDSKRSLEEKNADLTRIKDTLSSMTNNCKRLEEEVLTLKASLAKSENLIKESEGLQKEVMALKEKQSLLRENEKFASNLKNRLTTH